MHLFLRGRNQRMGSSKDIELGFRQVWISGYLCWHETTKLNSVQLNLPFPCSKTPSPSKQAGGKINSVCIDINVQHYASKWNHSSREEHKAFINNMCWNQITISFCLSGGLPSGKPNCCRLVLFTTLTTSFFWKEEPAAFNLLEWELADGKAKSSSLFQSSTSFWLPV